MRSDSLATLKNTNTSLQNVMVVTVAMTKPFLSVLTFLITKGGRSDVVTFSWFTQFYMNYNNVAFRVRTKVARRKLPTFPSSSHLFVTSSSHSQNYHRRSSSLKGWKGSNRYVTPPLQPSPTWMIEKIIHRLREPAATERTRNHAT